MRFFIGTMWFQGSLWKLPLPISGGLDGWTRQHHHLRHERGNELALASHVVNPCVHTVVERHFDIEVDLQHLLVCLVQHLGKLYAWRDHEPVKTGIQRIGRGATVVHAMGANDLQQRCDLIEAPDVVAVVVDNACSAIDLIARLVKLIDLIARLVKLIDAGIWVDRRSVLERNERPDLGEVLPGIVTGQQTPMEATDDQIRAA
jgi:hypothetical protein